MPFAGTEDLTRSHFETQDSVELGFRAVPARRQRLRVGLSEPAGRRRSAATGHPSFTDGLPVVMTGDVVVPNVSLKGTAGRRSTIARRTSSPACTRARASSR